MGETCGRSTYGTWSITGESLCPLRACTLPRSTWRLAWAAKVCDMMSVLLRDGPAPAPARLMCMPMPMPDEDADAAWCAGPLGSASATDQSAPAPSAMSEGGLRRVRRLPVPGFAIWP